MHGYRDFKSSFGNDRLLLGCTLFLYVVTLYSWNILLIFRVKEERFWRNYFYRVSLIKQSTQLSSLADQGVLKYTSSSQFFVICCFFRDPFEAQVS